MEEHFPNSLQRENEGEIIGIELKILLLGGARVDYVFFKTYLFH
ncbi:MAG: hypothetical protein R3E32_28760 [Chitinophagales bacterium]